jgi:aryl-alcohol dehydrogenase-like predicted oxidoreductase
MFRQRPAELFFREAKKRNIGIIVRVPLASGLLTGKFDRSTSFTSGDHRNFNRNGEAFDKGETFSGIDYNLGLSAVEDLKKIFPGNENLAPVALKWILMFEEVSCIIPGASKPSHLDSNFKTLSIPDLTTAQIAAVKEIYENKIKKHVHFTW